MGHLAASAAGLSAVLGLPLDLQAEPASFTNPLYSGADPWVTQHANQYYHCFTGPGGRIQVSSSSCLAERGPSRTVWIPPVRGWNSREIWAPELHYIRGRWYIYYAASDGHNKNHRMGVLEATTDDPQGPYVDRGILYTGDDIRSKRNNRWAIDGTVMEVAGQLYFLWSGWEDDRDVQYLYIATMSDPLTLSSNRVRLCANDTYPWERVGEDIHQRGLHEGPAILQRNGKIFLIYSCSGSWQHTYKLGLLHASDQADLLDPRSWKKLNRPVFETAGDVFGVGHCSFATSPDGSQDWILYHSKRSWSDGWDRVVHAQPFTWGLDGFPEFGAPVPNGAGLLSPSRSRKTAPSLATHGAPFPRSAAASADVLP